VRRIPTGRLEQVAAAAVIALIVVGLALLIPAAAQRLGSLRPSPTPVPTATPTAPPASVLLPEELDRDLQGVMTIVNDKTFGTAFLIDARGDFLTAASLVSGSAQLRLIDNTGGMHAVRLIGVDSELGIAEIRVTSDGTPMTIGDASILQVDDPLVLIASPKLQNLQPATPAVVTGVDAARLRLRVQDQVWNLGGPVAGPGGKVVGILTASGTALPIGATLPDVNRWRAVSGTVLPLAPLPPNLVLRGSETTSTPSAGPTVDSVTPARSSTTQETLLTIHGGGFTAGPLLRVRFLPLASPTGAFDGLAATIAGASTVTVKVPAGQAVQDYVLQLINGDGTISNSRIAFTVTP
jgi:IPT/TIG domain